MQLIIVLWSGGNDKSRETFIGKEKDNESSLGDFGVRKYDDFAGRFFQIDPMWELQYQWTPYHYAANNPISAKDPNGDLLDVFADVGFIIYDIVDITVTAVSGDDVTAVQWGALGVDIAAAFVPFVTGAGLAVKGSAKAVSHADDVKKVVKTVDKVGDAKRTTKGLKAEGKPLWSNKQGKGRLDYEKPAVSNTGKTRRGQVHYQVGKTKYIYDPATKTFKGLDKKLQKKLMKNKNFTKAIEKGLKRIGE